MPLFFNKVQRGNPGDPKSPKKWYLILKSIGLAKSKEVARLMADETTLNPKEAEISLAQAGKVVGCLLKSGQTVELEGLGTFYLTANSAASDTEAEVTARNLKGLNIRFRPDEELQAEVDKAQLKPATNMTPSAK